ncbi:unnamed protein product [Lymnaea stagnalis]|uniref:Uncharacterized protein n=1 Tax=Lymnaea stagnalis TaxID=6523 RepID=A0AAV2HAH9_LYMST
MRKQSDMLLTAIYVTFTITYVVCVSPDLGAPDSNNLNMEFTPDDSAAGGLDTSLDNSNATPMVITTPPMTTSTTPTTTTTTTQPTTTTVKLSTTSSSTTSTTTRTSSTTSRTTPTTSTTTSTTTPRRTTAASTTSTTRTTPRAPTTPPPTTTVKNDYNRLPTQFPYDPNPPFNPYPNGWGFPNHHNPHNQHNQHGTGQWSGGRLNIPWWMLLLEEV